MKKLLALVLALVMTLSLCVTSNAAYDGEEYDFDEAVEVMTALGVFQGDENGKFNGKDVLTREQAAKIVTYMILGKTAADALVTIAAPFADVEATRWSAGSIAYCYNEGILAGVGAGKFDPNGQLTGLAFAKMMLVALGYKAENEGLTGESWSINTAKLALTVGLTDDIEDISLSAPMTRELAAKMAFNAEQSTMVFYDNNSVITAGNVTVKTSSAAEVVYNWNSSYNNGTDDTMQFCEKYSPKLKLTVGHDAFGRPSNTWNYKNSKVGEYADTPDKVYTAEVKMSAIYEDLALGDAVSAAKTGFYVCGDDTETAMFNGTTVGTLGLGKNISTKIGGDGIVTEVFYSNDAKSARIVMYAYLLAQATEDYDEKDEDIELEVFSTLSGNVTLDADDFAMIKDLKEDDYVVLTYTYVGGTLTVESVAKADVVEKVTVSEARANDYVVAGEKYVYSDAKTSGSLGFSLMDANGYSINKTEYNLYLDPNGFVLGVEGYDAGVNLDDYVFVKDRGTSGFDVIAKVVFADGTSKTVTVDKVGTTDITTSNYTTYVTAGNFYKFDTDKDGNYELTVVPTSSTTAKVLQTSITSAITNAAKPVTALTSLVGTSTTKFIAKSTVYEGVKNAPTVASGAVYVLHDDTSRLLLVYSGTAGSATTSSDNLVYILNSNPAETKDGDDTYYVYDAVVNGEKTKLNANQNSRLVGLYKIATYTDGRADLGTAIDGTTVTDALVNVATSVTAAYKNGTVTFGSDAYLLADNCTIITVDGNTVKTINASGIEKAVNTDLFNDVYAIEVSSSNSDIAVLYLVK